jgi:hypothetical protein
LREEIIFKEKEMRISRVIIGFALISMLTAIAVQAQTDKLNGLWEGSAESMQGKRPAKATFKKGADGYTGTITGLRGDVPFKEIKVEGDNITALAEIQTPQATVQVKYKFTVQGEALKGEGEVDFGGQTFVFTYDFKRTSNNPDAKPTAATSNAPDQQQQRPQTPQPQQKQSLNYFAGSWNFKWIGMETPLGPGLREGSMSFTPTAGGRALEFRGESKTETGAFRESGSINYDEQKKALSFRERRGNGVEIMSTADWSSPISIRFSVQPVKAGGQTFQIRRTISVVSAHSFTVLEEVSIDGGPFQRLGSGVFSKAN